MLPAKFLPLLRGTISSRNIHKSALNLEKYENPFLRTLKVLRDDLRAIRRPNVDENPNLMNIFPSYVDVLVIGGGVMGSSVAYWLKEKSGLNGVKLAVLEKDPTYANSTSILSMGGLRQQFSLPENIQMSLYGAEFIRTLKDRFGREGDVSFTPSSCLTLASEIGASQLVDTARLQKELGALNVILSANQLKERFPWMNVNDIEAGCLGLEMEGWFDSWALFCLLKKGAMNLGAQYVTGELNDFVFTNRHDIEVEGVQPGNYEGIDEVIVKLPDGQMKSIHFSICVLACGTDTGDVAKLARIGKGEGLLSIPLPIEKRKRYVYNFSCQDEGPGLNTPLTMDYTGVYFRRDGLGGTYVGGLSPLPEEELKTDDLDANNKYFDEKFFSILAHRVPAFKGVKVRNKWSGLYDYNYYDENGIVGPHPYYHNMYIAAGFSGHGIQQAPAVGRAIAELILDGDFQTISLNRLGFDRLIVDKPIREICIV
ncbi:sarcosine dehydrogenase-related [Holotrichia oblita]|uniref:Sarcosine dehydrogenase-related n=1 Tax=Holotrichia oblita TaxID=644536 RepID=A0ACB9TBT2_HOLOL|nr:sarcosine dehydrogenase-related [Holotrichia oblita]